MNSANFSELLGQHYYDKMKYVHIYTYKQTHRSVDIQIHTHIEKLKKIHMNTHMKYVKDIVSKRK